MRRAWRSTRTRHNVAAWGQPLVKRYAIALTPRCACARAPALGHAHVDVKGVRCTPTRVSGHDAAASESLMAIPLFINGFERAEGGQLPPSRHPSSLPRSRHRGLQRTKSSFIGLPPYYDPILVKLLLILAIQSEGLRQQGR